MNVYDILILAAIVLAAVLALRHIRAVRRRGGCSCCAEGTQGGCKGSCASCRTSCKQGE